MIFRVLENYDDNIYSDYKIKECFICYEIKNELPINLEQQIYYLKLCSCNGWIHKTCLDSWFFTKNSCPVCRTNMTKNLQPVSQVESKTIIIQDNILYTKFHILIFKNMIYWLFMIFTIINYTGVIFLLVKIYTNCDNVDYKNTIIYNDKYFIYTNTNDDSSYFFLK